MHDRLTFVTMDNQRTIRVVNSIWGVPVVAMPLIGRAAATWGESLNSSHRFSDGNISSIVPLSEHHLLESRKDRGARNGRLAQAHEVSLNLLEQCHPDATVLAPVSPVAILRRSGALAFACKEEPAILTAKFTLRRLVQRQLALMAFGAGLQPVYSILVRTPAIG